MQNSNMLVMQIDSKSSTLKMNQLKWLN